MSDTLRSTIEEERPVERIDEKLPQGIRGRLEEYAGNGTLALALGAVGLVQGLRTLRSNPTGGVLRLLFGGVWLAVGLTQRRGVDSAGPATEDVGFDDLGEVTPGKTDDDLAAKNTLPPTDVGKPQAQEVGLSEADETTNEPADTTGPDDDDAAPMQDKTRVPGETPDDVTMVGDENQDDEEHGGDENQDDEEHGGDENQDDEEHGGAETV